jgi:hypothetical protein
VQGITTVPYPMYSSGERRKYIFHDMIMSTVLAFLRGLSDSSYK